MRHVALLMIFSLIACAQVERPDADFCIVNAPGKTRSCYNIKNDYDDTGHLKPGAVAVIRRNESIEDLNKAFVVDSEEGFVDGLARFKAYLKQLREEAQRRCE